jgi:hypothetical protein
MSPEKLVTTFTTPDQDGPADGDLRAGLKTPARADKPVKPAKQDKTTLILLLIAAFVAVGGVGFAVGHMTASGGTANAAASGRGGFGGRNFASLAPGQTFNVGAFAGRAGIGAGGVSGTVVSISADGSTMTVQLANGTIVTVDLTGSTTYHGETSASSSDVKVGSSVTVQVDTSAAASQTPAPNASGSRTVSAKDVLVTNP